MLIGITLTLLIGQTVPKPAPLWVIEALQSVEVTHSNEGRSGFQIVLRVGRSGSGDLRDYKSIRDPLLKAGNRVILIVTLNARPRVLMDGIITNQQLSPSMEPGGSTLTITGEDVSVMMDLLEQSVEHPAQDPTIIVNKLISNYSQYGLIPQVIKPPMVDRPLKTERIPVQQGTDLEYLKMLAKRYAYIFYVLPGPTSGTNTAYWGPPMRKTRPQKALSVNMGSYTNVESINFQNNSLAATTVTGKVQDRKTNRIQKVQANMSDRTPLAKQSALQTKGLVRRQQFRETGRDTTQALTRAQAITDRSVDEAVTVTGELDTLRYGELLELRAVVGLRGVGYSYDGLYAVKSVTHKIRKGEYKQSFAIAREGLGTTTQFVKV